MATFARGDESGSATSVRTRTVVIAGLLGAIQIVLGVTRLGFIPLPTGVQGTILHIPAIVGGVVEGPIVGVAVGLIFGIASFLQATNPAFADPLVSILPRLFPGLTAWAAFAALHRWNQIAAAMVAGVVGTLTNTVLVLGMGMLRGYFPLELAGTVAVTNGPFEVLFAAIITPAVVLAVAGRGARRRSTV